VTNRVDNLTELQALLESDLSTLYGLVNTFGTPLTDGNIRAASGILRRWFGESLIGRLCNDLGLTPTFPVLDNAAALKTAALDPNIDYFLTAGVRLQDAPVMFIYNSSAPPPDRQLFSRPDAPYVLMSTGAFLDQRRVYFEGNFISTRDIITFTANKLGGVHFDGRRNERQAILQRAADFMTYGGPLNQINREPPGPLYMSIEPNGREILSGFHLEIIAAASSFVHLHMDGQQLVNFPPRRKRWISRLLGEKGPRSRCTDTEASSGGGTGTGASFTR